MLCVTHLVFIALCTYPVHSVDKLKQWLGYGTAQNQTADAQARPDNDPSLVLLGNSPAIDSDPDSDSDSDPDNFWSTANDVVPPVSPPDAKCHSASQILLGGNSANHLSLVPGTYGIKAIGPMTYENIEFFDQENKNHDPFKPQSTQTGNVHVSPQTTTLKFKNCKFKTIVTHDALHTIIIDRQTLNRIMPNDDALNRHHHGCTLSKTQRPFVEHILIEEQCNGVKDRLEEQKNQMWFWHKNHPELYVFQRFNPYRTTCISSLSQYETIQQCAGINMNGVNSTPVDRQDYLDNLNFNFVPGDIDCQNKKIPALILERCQFKSLVNIDPIQKITVDDDTLNALFPPGILTGNAVLVQQRIACIKKDQCAKFGKMLREKTNAEWTWEDDNGRTMFQKKHNNSDDDDASSSEY